MNFKIWIEAFIDPETKEKYNFNTRKDFLNKFKGQKDIFVTFHDIPKFGLNPDNAYNTPTALYSYPIDYVLNRWDEKSKSFNVPYASNAKFSTIFKHVKNKLIVINFDETTYDYLDEVTFLPKKYDEILVEYVYDNLITYIPKIKSYIPSLEALLRSIKYNKLFLKNEFLKVLSWLEGPPGVHYRHPVMPAIPQEEIENFKNNLFKNMNLLVKKIETIKQDDIKKYKFPYEDDIKPLWDDENEFYYDKERLIGGDAIISQTFTDTRKPKYARLKSRDSFPWVMLLIKAGNNKNKFNSLCRKAGIAGFLDNGTGTIHENEPTQAVFFNINDLKIIHPSPIENLQFGSEDKQDLITNIGRYLSGFILLTDQEVIKLNTMLRNLPKGTYLPHPIHYKILQNIHFGNEKYLKIINGPNGKKLLNYLKKLLPEFRSELLLDNSYNKNLLHEKTNEMANELTELIMQEVKKDLKTHAWLIPDLESTPNYLKRAIRSLLDVHFIDNNNVNFITYFELGDATNAKFQHVPYINLKNYFYELSNDQIKQIDDSMYEVFKNNFNSLLQRKVKEYKNEILNK